MRDVVNRLVFLINEWNPDLVLFFATGSLPYVLPAINLLGLTRGEDLLNRSVFHMFPGLAWSGKIDGQSSEEFFIREVLLLLKQKRSCPDAVKILCVDTTNTGNAVNKVLKAMSAVCERFPSETEVRVVGIVNGAESAPPGPNTIPIEYGGEFVVHVARPSRCTLPQCMESQLFAELFWSREIGSSRFFVSYWVLDHLPTEDKAALVGATSIHEALAVGTNSESGRLLILMDNGMRVPFSSIGTVGKQLSGLLTSREDSASWVTLNNQSQILPEQIDKTKDSDDLQSEVLQSFEIDEDPTAIEGIREKTVGLLTAAEIRALADGRHFDAQLQAMVRATLKKTASSSLREEFALCYFRSLEQFNCECCHEAGHATVRYLNGDMILSIVIPFPDEITAGASIGERGRTTFRHRTWHCNCGGFVRDGHEENESEVKVTAGCASCEEYLTYCLAGVFAGDAATRLLASEAHQSEDSGFDEGTARAILNDAVIPDHHQSVEQNARRIASQVVRDHSDMILRVRDILFNAYGYLDGIKAAEALSQ